MDSCENPPAARPLPAGLRQHRAREPYQGFPRREDLHDAAAALYLPVRAFLDVVRAQPHVVGVGEVRIRQGIGLCILEKPAGSRAYAAHLVAGEAVQFPRQLRVAFPEDGGEYR